MSDETQILPGDDQNPTTTFPAEAFATVDAPVVPVDAEPIPAGDDSDS